MSKRKLTKKLYELYHKKPDFDENKEISNGIVDYLKSFIETTKPLNTLNEEDRKFLIENLQSYETSIKQEESQKEKPYHEIIQVSNLPKQTYYVTESAMKEISDLVDEEEIKIHDKSFIDYNSIIHALEERKVYLARGDLEDQIHMDREGIGFIESSEKKYLLANDEASTKLKEMTNLTTIYMETPLPGDIIRISELDESTKKKINNLEYGGSTHKLLEPTDHNWEDDHARD